MSAGVEPKQVESVKDQYEESIKKLRIARKTITVSLVAVILLALMSIWSAANGFMDEGLPEFANELHRGIHPVAVSHLDDVQDAIGEVFPVYSKEFQEMFSKNLPLMEAALDSELTKLEAYAQKRWPDFQNSIERLAFDQERLVVESLEKIVGEDRAAHVNKMYEDEIRRRVEDFFLNNLVEHQDVIDDIRANLDKLARTEPDIIPPVELHEAIGVLLELAGVKLQQGIELDIEGV